MLNEDNVHTIRIPMSLFLALNEDSNTLQKLYNAGVDNWDGYDWAMEENN